MFDICDDVFKSIDLTININININTQIIHTMLSILCPSLKIAILVY